MDGATAHGIGGSLRGPRRRTRSKVSARRRAGRRLKRCHRDRAARRMAVRQGFEPWVQVLSPYNGLANRRLQPLGHLTADAKCNVKSALAGSKFYIARMRRFFEPPHASNPRKNRLISQAHPKHFGHTREKASRIRGALMARVVRRRHVRLACRVGRIRIGALKRPPAGAGFLNRCRFEPFSGPLESFPARQKRVFMGRTMRLLSPGMTPVLPDAPRARTAYRRGSRRSAARRRRLRSQNRPRSATQLAGIVSVF